MIIKNDGEKVESRCPICGKELNGTQYLAEVWGTMRVAEVHAYCPECTYRAEMAYSELFEFICETDLIQNRRKAEKLGVDIISEKEYNMI